MREKLDIQNPPTQKDIDAEDEVNMKQAIVIFIIGAVFFLLFSGWCFHLAANSEGSEIEKALRLLPIPFIIFSVFCFLAHIALESLRAFYPLEPNNEQEIKLLIDLSENKPSIKEYLHKVSVQERQLIRMEVTFLKKEAKRIEQQDSYDALFTKKDQPQ